MAIAASFPTIRPSLLLDFANSGVLDPRITFSRSTTATYYDGVTTAKAEENLFQYSEQFDNAYWTKTRLTITANATTAPDGTSTAESAVPTAEDLGHRISRNVTVSSSGNIVWSIFAKANGYNFIVINARTAASDRNCWFNLSTGAVGTNLSGGTASIESVGSGWYRCVVVRASEGTTAVNEISVSSTDNVTSFVANGTDGIYLWGAQLEQRDAVTAYTPTTTQPITNYIPVLQTAAANVARFDHNPTTGEALGLLIEEQRTNLFTYSEQFNNVAWTAGGSATTQVNTVVAPDGTLTGDKLVEAVGAITPYCGLYQQFTASATNYAFSTYIKQGQRAYAALLIGPASSYNGAFFNLSNGTVASTSGTIVSSAITDVGDGWYRCTVVYLGSSGTATFARVVISPDGVNREYTGNGYSGIYIWGAQLEAGAFPTSYIATTSATVTRNADAASMTGTNFSSWFNAGGSTLYLEADRFITSTTGRGLQFDDGTSNNRWYVGADVNWFLSVTSGGVNQVGIVCGPVTANTMFKIVGAVKANDFAASGAGLSPGTDSSGVVPSVNIFRIGVSENGIYWNGHIRKASYYPERLTDANLQALTA